MNWKKIGTVARLVAYAVVPGAAGYAAYRYVVRPWLDGRKVRQVESGRVPPEDFETQNDLSEREDDSGYSQLSKPLDDD